MSDVLVVKAIRLSPNSKKALQRNGVYTLNELMVQHDLGLLTSKNYDKKTLHELLEVCEEIGRFYEKLNERLMLDEPEPVLELAPVTTQKEYSYDEGRHRAFESIKNDLITIANLEQPTSLRKAILAIFASSAHGVYDRKRIKTMVEKKCRGVVSVNSDTIRSVLSSLVSHDFLRRVECGYTRGGVFDKVLRETVLSEELEK